MSGSASRTWVHSRSSRWLTHREPASDSPARFASRFGHNSPQATTSWTRADPITTGCGAESSEVNMAIDPMRGSSGVAIGRCRARPSRRMAPESMCGARVVIAAATSSSVIPNRRIEVRPSRTTRRGVSGEASATISAAASGLATVWMIAGGVGVLGEGPPGTGHHLAAQRQRLEHQDVELGLGGQDRGGLMDGAHRHAVGAEPPGLGGKPDVAHPVAVALGHGHQGGAGRGDRVADPVLVGPPARGVDGDDEAHVPSCPAGASGPAGAVLLVVVPRALGARARGPGAPGECRSAGLSDGACRSRRPGSARA